MNRTRLLSAILVAVNTPAGLAWAEAETAQKLQARPATQLEKISVESQLDTPLERVDISTSTTLQPSAEERRKNGTASLGAALDALPGVDTLETGPQSGKPVVRGDTSLRLPILSNGVTMEYQAEGTRHNPNVDPALMERLEVIRGPQGLKYSSQAVKSAVNVVGPQIDYAGPGETKASGELMGEINSNNNGSLMGAKAKLSSNGFGLVGGITKRNGNDFVTPNTAEAGEVKPGDPPGSKPLVTGTTPYTNYEGGAAVIGAGYQGEWGEVELRYNYWESKQNYLGVAASPMGYALVPSAGQHLTNSETQLKAEFFAGDWVIKPKYAHSRNQRQAMHGIPYEDMDDFRDDEEYLNLVVERNDYQLALEHPTVWGWNGEFGLSGYTKDQDLRSGHLTPSATDDGVGVFVVEKQSFGPWDVEVGARYDTAHVNAPMSEGNEHFWGENGVYDSSNHSRDFSDWSGGLGLAYHHTSNWTFTGNLGRSVRFPSIFELYASGAHGGVQAYQLGNPDLKAETSINSELAAVWQSANLQSTFSVYSNWVENYIVLENTEDTLYCDEEGQCQPKQSLKYPYRKMVNGQTNALIQGIEWSATYKMTPQLTWMATAEVLQGRDTTNDRELPLMPANNATLSAQYTFASRGYLHQPYVGVGTKYAAPKDSAGAYEPFSQFDNTPFGTASTQDYWLWDLEAGTGFKFGKQRLSVDLTVQNLMDVAYRDFLDTYKGYAQGMGRNFRLSARMPFGD